MDRETKDLLIVAAKIKKYIRDKAGLKTSGTAIGFLSDFIRKQLDAAIECTLRDGRKTVMDRDFDGIAELFRHGDIAEIVAAEVARALAEADVLPLDTGQMDKKITALEKQVRELAAGKGKRKKDGPDATTMVNLENLEEQVRKAAAEVVNLAWEKRVLPELGALARRVDKVAVPTKLFSSEIFLEKVRLMAAEERREAKAELIAVVEETLENIGGLSGGSVPRNIIETTVKDVLSRSLKDVKALAKRIDPLVRERLNKLASSSLAAFVTKTELMDTVQEGLDRFVTDRVTLEADMERRLKEIRKDFKAIGRRLIKESLEAEIGQKLTRITSSPAVTNAAREAIRREISGEAILEVAIKRILTSDEIKKMIDDRFRTIQMFLQNELIPQLLKKFIQEKR
jgi:hypothetical protein